MKQNLQNSRPKNSGFIAIIALGVLGLLSIFGLIVYGIVVDTYSGVRSSNNYYAARDLSDSVIENLLFKLNSHEPGWNFDVECNYTGGRGTTANGAGTNGENPTSSTDTQACTDMGLDALAGNKEVKVVVEVKGRPDDDETLLSEKCKTSTGNFNSSCYVIPFAGTGTAAKKCTAYEPFADNDKYVNSNLIGGINDLDHADYACNWNKLTFGSSLTDRVAIPLFYEDENEEVVNPFKDGDGENFILRIRTPCIDGSEVCDATERYKLDDTEDGNDIVVQWQLNGECEGEGPCGLVAYVDEDFYSAIDEIILNTFLLNPSRQFIILSNGDSGFDINSNDEAYLFPYLSYQSKLELMDKPIFTLFLSDKLIDEGGKNIPYLEYQILTDLPIGGSQTMLKATALIDGNAFIKTLWKEEQKPLIDFAIQN
ncbi:MAG: hypothetical protein AAB373_00325 [Patescibacteria group bacterium]